MYTQPYLKTASELRSEMRDLLNDPSSATNRWSDDQYIRCLNKALREISERVYIPALYSLTDGFEAGTYGYSVPNYVKEPLYVELRRELTSLQLSSGDSGTSDSTWKPVSGWRLEPDGSGGQVLRLHTLPYSVDGRIVYFVHNGDIPLDSAVLAADFASDDTTINVTTAEDVPPVGWVKIDDEWVEYHGITRNGSSVLLGNALHARFDTVADDHISGTTVYWGVAVDTPSVWNVIEALWESELHRTKLTGAADGERRRHQEQIMYLKGVIDDFWRTKYIPNFTPSLSLGPGVL